MRLSLPEPKPTVRSRHLAMRRSLQPEERKRLSKLIIERTLDTDEFRSADVVHSYAAIDKNGEVSTDGLISACLKHGKKVIVPKMKSNGELSHHSINSLDSLKTNEWGVPEPEFENEASLQDGILIIVPMVASDFKLNRLGYGKGYYDRFLSKLQSTKIGLSYSFNLCWNILPTEDFDIQMNVVVTDRFTIR